MADIDVSDPLMEHSAPGTFWTTVNAAEARPGVSTPMSQSVWGEASELAARQAFCDMGVIPQAMVKVGPPDENICAVFYGRCAANVDTLRKIADRTPGMSGDGLERQFLGSVRPGIEGRRALGRLPVVAAKAPAVLARSASIMTAMEPEYHAWWHAQTAPRLLADLTDAGGRLDEALMRFRRAMWIQLRVTYMAQGIFDKLAQLAETAGLPGLERTLVSGYGTLVEGSIVADLHALGTGTLDRSEFQAKWGFHGPREGELMSRSWREDTVSLERAVAAHLAAHPEAPHTAAERRAEVRRAAERELLAGLRSADRAIAKVVIRLARSYVPLREVGKSMYVQAVDVARAVARGLGRQWHTERALADAEDVFFLTIPELRAGPAPSTDEVVAVRRARHERYLRLTLPRTWTGTPEPIPLDRPVTGRGTFEGVAVSRAETVAGRARVIIDPGTADPVEPGEILVCESTDPSWVALFVAAAGLVIDIGGPLSHGAIVARELGIPAVVNTGDATRVLRTGDRISIDGKTGTVTVLERAADT